MAVSARTLSGDMQVGEFLTFIRPRPKEERWQLVEGVAVMITPASVGASTDCDGDFRDLLKEALARKGLDLLVLNEIGVRVSGVANFLPRPDVVVFPEILGDEIYADRFFLVAEVLSPSNTKSLIAQKLRRYKAHPDNLYCVVIDSRRPWLQVHACRSGWVPTTLNDPAAVLDLPEFALRCTVGDLYHRTPLDPKRGGGGAHLRLR